MRKNPQGARTLDRGLQVLNALSDHNMTAVELEKHTGLNCAVIYRMLEALHDRGFVIREPNTKRFQLGPALITLGERSKQILNIRTIALPGMHRLMEFTKETVCLGVKNNRELIIVESIAQPWNIRVNYPVGARHSLLLGPFGQVILAWADNTSDNMMAAIRSTGFVAKRINNTVGVAAAILGTNGHPIASIGIVAPFVRLQDPKQYSSHVVALALDISRQLIDEQETQ